jgi:2-desacetyl-2-hydroxyethyl bacteriochlorophyllide A dehydrogenase
VRALVVSSPGHVALEEVDEPSAGPGEVLIHPIACGLCGTDLELIDGTIDPAYVRYPLTLGHEWVGRFAGSTGDESSALVVVEGVIPCGACDECGIGDTNRCRVYDEIGFTRPGAIAGLISVPSILVHRLSPTVSIRDAALVEPMAVVWRALTRAGIRSDSSCLVVGDGTVALLTAHLLQRFAPSSTTVLGLRDAQRGLALRAGADHFTTAPTSQKYDVVVEAAGHVDAVTTALSSVGRGGSVTLLGLPPHGTRVSLAPDDFVNDDLTLQGSFSYTRVAWAEVVALLNEGAIAPSFLVTHAFALDAYAEALAMLRDPPADAARGKVLILLDE